jgi:hypothetical protein
VQVQRQRVTLLVQKQRASLPDQKQRASLPGSDTTGFIRGRELHCKARRQRASLAGSETASFIARLRDSGLQCQQRQVTSLPSSGTVSLGSETAGCIAGSGSDVHPHVPRQLASLPGSKTASFIRNLSRGSLPGSATAASSPGSRQPENYQFRNSELRCQVLKQELTPRDRDSELHQRQRVSSQGSATASFIVRFRDNEVHCQVQRQRSSLPGSQTASIIARFGNRLDSELRCQVRKQQAPLPGPETVQTAATEAANFPGSETASVMDKFRDASFIARFRDSELNCQVHLRSNTTASWLVLMRKGLGSQESQPSGREGLLHVPAWLTSFHFRSCDDSLQQVLENLVLIAVQRGRTPDSLGACESRTC